ncbi:ArdC family protein [Sphingopyxis sp. KK2]|uniref:ArdC family protein n=1 Tax=Sphingopyxis sp. KK2 TaxID=1855727 RepID=UPI00097E6EF3|nr:zincin-like metallopeptidase domain-containing protein [Sphingopyxis sp. KK2]
MSAFQQRQFGDAAQQDRASRRKGSGRKAGARREKRGKGAGLSEREARGEHEGGSEGRGGNTAPRPSLYDEVTARIVAELEEGRFPWTQPWDAKAFAPGLPRNADTRRSYSGINILILWSEAMRRGFGSHGWLTYRQAEAVGGQVRKGERGTTIFYAARFTPKDASGNGGGAASGGAAVEGGRTGGGNGAGGAEGDARSVPFLKSFTVFNVAQVDGLPDRCTLTDQPLPEREPLAETLLAASGADIRIGGNEAYYSPGGDYVALPPQQAFFAQIDYYRTALHELGHWTGHKSRLDRDQSGGFASAAYGREELCAELASAFLCAALGIAPTVRHADYLGAWLAIMRADTRAIFKAASLASKAADYLLGFTPATTKGGEASAGNADRAPASRAEAGAGG